MGWDRWFCGGGLFTNNLWLVGLLIRASECFATVLIFFQSLSLLHEKHVILKVVFKKHGFQVAHHPWSDQMKLTKRPDYLKFHQQDHAWNLHVYCCQLPLSVCWSSCKPMFAYVSTCQPHCLLLACLSVLLYVSLLIRPFVYLSSVSLHFICLSLKPYYL